MKKQLKKSICAALALAMAFSMTACGGGDTSSTPSGGGTPSGTAPSGTGGTEQVSTKDTLTIALDREPAALDPPVSNVAVKRMIENNLFDTLLKFDDNMTPKAWIAESWEQVDELTWKFNLKKGVKFHNGDELTSKDVLFTFMRQYDMATGSENVEEFDPAGFQTPDDYTFILKTKRPYAFVEAQLCSQGLAIVNEKSVTEQGNDAFGRNPIGSGPFKFVSWTAGDRITVERNDEYWGEKAKLKTLVFRIITESASRTIDLESGGIDMTLALPNNDAQRIEDNPETVLIKHPSTTLRYIAFNAQKDMLKDKRVRQALNYATDAPALQEVIYGKSESELAISPVAPGLPGRNDKLVQYDLDLDKAKQLLTEAGYPDGFSVEFMYLANSQNNMMVEMLQEMWKKVGVTLVLKPTESGALTTALNKGEQQICSAGTSFALNDPGDGLYRFFHTDRMYSSTARSNLSDPEVDKILDEIIITQDQAKRNDLVYKAQELIHEQSPMIYIANPYNLIGASAKIRGFKTPPSSIYDFTPVYFVE